MNYEIRHFDTTVLKFSAENGAESNIKVLWVTSEKQLLPLELSGIENEDVANWIKHRTIPQNRANVNSLLASMNLSPNRPMDVIRASNGLSLNDCFWITEEGFKGSFEKYNLYDNKFSRVLSLIAFTGYGSSEVTGMTSSPEFTTNGMLPKCWRRDNGIKLYKGGTEGASNTGYEPYSEFYSWQLAEALEINAIPYNLKKWKGKLCSVCDIFTSKELSFVPIGRIIKTGGIKAVRRFYEELGEEYVAALNEMLIFDAVIFNTDRHYGNFGVLVDSLSNKIVAPAPLFDHGNALFSLIGLDSLENDETVTKYANTLLPRVYDDFVSEAKKYLTYEHRNKIRTLLDFKFKKHSRYNLPSKRLKLIEKQVSRRAKGLLD